MKTVILILAIIMYGKLTALDLNLAATAVQNGGAGSYLICPSPGSAQRNPAFIYPGAEISGSFLYSLPELPVINSTISYEFNRIGFTASFFHLGHPLYQESIIQLGSSYDLSLIRIGLEIRQITVAVGNYGKSSYITAGGGLIWQQDRLVTGLSVKNCMAIKTEEIGLPLWLEMESCLALSKQSRIAVGLEKQTEEDFSFRFAAYQDIYRLLGLEAGYQYNPDLFCAGIRVEVAGVILVFSSRFHLQLGLTHFISLCYDL